MAVKIVDKELALKLKELGFDMEISKSYERTDGINKIYNEIVEANYNDVYYAVHKNKMSAPTYDEVLHWLRDAHDMNARPVHTGKRDDKINYWAVLDVYGIDGWEDKLRDFKTYTYENAQLAIINKAIEILEQLKNKEHE